MKNYGFIEPKIDFNHYVCGDGRLGATVLNPSGNWENWLPVYEPQTLPDGEEEYGCTVWGMQNQLETLIKFLTKKERNFDERFNYNLANINPPGTDPQITYETGRRNGFTEGVLPMTQTLAEFRTPRPMVEPYLSDGLNFEWNFDHDWVLTGKETSDQRIQLLKSNLPISPIGVSVTAWFEQNGIYVDNGLPNNHWCVLYKMDDKYFYIFDSYDQSTKMLPLTHTITYAKRITLTPKITPEKKKNIIIVFWELLKENLLSFFPSFVNDYKNTPTMKTNTETLIDIVNGYLGKDASPLDKAPDEYGCAESVSNILHEVLPDFPDEVLSTSTLATELDKCAKIERVLEPDAGVIIVSPRTDTAFGHTGIFISPTQIVSNDSRTGLMGKNYTWDSWISTFKKGRGLKILLWKFIN